jgi:hypothetical protein
MNAVQVLVEIPLIAHSVFLELPLPGEATKHFTSSLAVVGE